MWRATVSYTRIFNCKGQSVPLNLSLFKDQLYITSFLFPLLMYPLENLESVEMKQLYAEQWEEEVGLGKWKGGTFSVDVCACDIFALRESDLVYKSIIGDVIFWLKSWKGKEEEIFVSLFKGGKQCSFCM